MSNIKLFNSKEIRTHWDGEKEEWFFSVVDVCGVLTDQPTHDRARKYWSVLKTRLKGEGSELATDCSQLKLQATDGKMRVTDVLDTKGILRLVQSIPSPKAEPFKVWLAQVGSERIEEIYDPEIAIDRALEFYRAKGYTEGWINQRLKTIEMRKELTDEWKDKGVTTGQDYAILTNEMTAAWAGMSTRQYKDMKGLTKENLRDNMTNIELVLNILAEVTTTTISKTSNPKSMQENIEVARRGGSVAGVAKSEYEKATGVSVISTLNASTKELLEINASKIED